MSVLSFLKKGKKDEVSLLVDIGHGSISCGIVLLADNSLPRFLYSVKKNLIFTKKPNTTKLVEDMSPILDTILADAVKQSLSIFEPRRIKNFSRVIVTFSSPWYNIMSKKIHIAKESPFLVTRPFIDQIIKDEEEVFQKILSEQSAFLDDEYVVVEKSIVNSKINGYSLDESIGKKTSNFEGTLFISAISFAIEDMVSNLILRHTHIPKSQLFMHSFPLIFFSFVRDIFPEFSDFLLISVTGESTDLTIALGHSIQNSTSIPVGHNTIIRLIAKKLKISPEIAISNLQLYTSDKITPAASEDIEDILFQIKEEWLVYLEDSLQRLVPEMSLPRKAFFTTNTGIENIFTEFLRTKDGKASGFPKDADITNISPDLLVRYFENNLKINIDTSLAITALFYVKMKSEG